MAQVFTRQQLHDLVWSGPMREVAKGLGISDVGGVVAGAHEVEAGDVGFLHHALCADELIRI